MAAAIFTNIIISVSLLAMAAYLLTKVRLIRKFVSADIRSIKEKIPMALFFGLTGVFATYGGIPVEGAIANTRVIGVIMGGILGGPFVGILAGLIAGLHRYAIDVGGLTALACAVSTVAEGLIGGLASNYIKKHRNQWYLYGLVTMLAEIVQMGLILLFARPFWQALALVKLIALPMILFNAAGVMIFANILESAFIEQHKEAARKIKLVLSIADQCLPHLRKGLHSTAGLDRAIQIILDMSEVSGVAITSCDAILSHAGTGHKVLENYQLLPAIAVQAIQTGQVRITEEAEPADPFHLLLKSHAVVCAPLTQKDGEAIGTLCLFIRKFMLSRDIECEFVSGLAKLFSTQIELSQLEYQKKLLQRAEIRALQSQINPHFLFNALSTITMFCREKPDRARELLLALSSYFRNTLRTGSDMISIHDEMRHVHAYIELEKARFEDKLTIEEDIPDKLECTMPSFILQPLVENSIKHGALKHAGPGRVKIRARKYQNLTLITITDNGNGISAEIQKKLFANEMPPESVGMSNVHKRLISIYGAAYGLTIKNRPQWCTVAVKIPNMSVIDRS